MTQLSRLQTQQPINFNQHNSPRQVDISGSNLVLLSVLAYPILLVLGAIVYRKYRAIARHRRIEALEKLLQLSPKK